MHGAILRDQAEPTQNHMRPRHYHDPEIASFTQLLTYFPKSDPRNAMIKPLRPDIDADCLVNREPGFVITPIRAGTHSEPQLPSYKRVICIC